MSILASRRSISLRFSSRRYPDAHATHGTFEFDRIKDRLIRALVKSAGLRSLLFEVDFAAVGRLNYWLRTGDERLGKPEEIVKGYELLDRDEVLDLLRWLRRYNVEHPGEPFTVTGVDCQAPGPAAQSLLEYLAQVDPPYAALVAPRLEALAALPWRPPGWDFQSNRALSFDEALAELDARKSVLEKAGSVVDEVSARLSSKEKSYRSAGGDLLFELAAGMPRALSQSLQLAVNFMPTPAPAGQPLPPDAPPMIEADRSMRDRFMSSNDLELASSQKSALWAENSHLARTGDGMGAALVQAFGERYVAIAQTLGHGEELGSPTAIPTPMAGSVDATFAAAANGRRSFAVDLRQPMPGEVEAWFDTARPFRSSIGAQFFPGVDYYQMGSPRALFDWVIFTDATTAAHR